MIRFVLTAMAVGLGASLDFECKGLLDVEYDIRYYNGKVACGSLLLHIDVTTAPRVQYKNTAAATDFFTLIMVDPDANLPNNGSWPDAPTAGDHAPVRHWVVGNIDAQSVLSGDFSTATTVSPYKGPSPPYGSHRYGQFIFRQAAGKIDDFEAYTAEDVTTNWNYTAFIEKHGLGEPVVSNWMIVQKAEPRAQAPRKGGDADSSPFGCTGAPLTVNYGTKYYSGHMNCGSLVLESDVGGGVITTPPKVYFPAPASLKRYYTLIMIDPDADLANNGSWPDVTTPGSHAIVRHWVVGNLSPVMLLDGDFKGATTISPFKGPSPPYGSHRYFQHLYLQPAGKIDDFETYAATDSITNWDFDGFVKKYDLGEPIGTNWHVVQHADPRPSATSKSVAEQGSLII